jgi:two-component system sensor histidine kinase KdpD
LEKEHFIQAVSHAELMEKSERLRSNLLDSVSHELKTPLAIIRASIEGMGETADNPYVVEIDTATKRLQRLVDGLLQMTRLEAKVVEPKLEWCDVAEIIEGAVKAAGDVLKSHPVEVDIAPDIPLVKTDQALLLQALANILHNAAVYSPDKTPVVLTARHAGRKLRLTVRDHGPGLPPGEESLVFGKFYRAEGTPAGGTGLGLSITRGFVQALGGDISGWNHPGGGAVFEILLTAEFMMQDEDGSCPAEPIEENARV